MFSKKKERKKTTETIPEEGEKSRRRVHTLSSSEKRLRRSTIGPSSLSSLPDIHAPCLKVIQQAPQSKSSDLVVEKSKNSVGPILTPEEKKSRRRSLLAPLLGLSYIKKVSTVPEASAASSEEKPAHKKKRKLKKGKKSEANTDGKVLKNKQRKKLQKQLDKIDKEKEREVNDMFTDSLSETLELGKKLSVPVPSSKREIVPPQRPHIIIS